MEVDHDPKVNPIDFEFAVSKVKVKGALSSKSLSTQLLKNALANSLHIWY
jgi:hypothetical protein